MNNIVTFYWKNPNAKKVFTAEHVNRLYRGCKKYFENPFKFHVFTTEVLEDYDDGVVVLPLDGGKFDTDPTTRKRLHLFNQEYCERVVGGKYLMLDMDIVLVDNCDFLFKYDKPFVGVQEPRWLDMVWGTLYVRTSNSLNDVYDNTPEKVSYTRAAGNDQPLLSEVAAKYKEDVHLLTRKDGIYPVKDVKNMDILPKNTKIVAMDGLGVHYDVVPYNNLPWVKKWLTETQK